MSNGDSMAEAMAELAQSIHATPNNRRRLKSGTFWERLGCKRRTPGVIEQVRGLLEHHRVFVSLRMRRSMEELSKAAFGSEDRDDWIVLTQQAPATTPPMSAEKPPPPTSDTIPLDSWFENMLQLSLRSESDVVNKFIRPVFEQLGYEEPDFAYEHPVEMHFGQEKFKKEADVVLFKRDDHIKDTHSPSNNLVLVEAKKLGKPIDGDVVGQAKSYAMQLSPVFYVVTNGNVAEVYLYRLTVAGDERVMCFSRTDLKQVWSELFRRLCKARVLEVKQKRQQIIAELQKL